MPDITVEDLTVDLLTRFDNFLHKWENEREPGKLLHPSTLRSLFAKKKTGADGLTGEEREQQAIELLKGMSPEQIMSIISAINK